MAVFNSFYGKPFFLPLSLNRGSFGYMGLFEEDMSEMGFEVEDFGKLGPLLQNIKQSWHDIYDSWIYIMDIDEDGTITYYSDIVPSGRKLYSSIYKNDLNFSKIHLCL